MIKEEIYYHIIKNETVEDYIAVNGFNILMLVIRRWHVENTFSSLSLLYLFSLKTVNVKFY